MRSVKNKIVANSFKGLQAAAAFFKENGMRPVIIGDDITGEARSVALQVSRSSPFRRRVHRNSGKGKNRQRRSVLRIPLGLGSGTSS